MDGIEILDTFIPETDEEASFRGKGKSPPQIFGIQHQVRKKKFVTANSSSFVKSQIEMHRVKKLGGQNFAKSLIETRIVV